VKSRTSLDQLQNHTWLVQTLTHAGLTPLAAETQSYLFSRCTDRLAAAGAESKSDLLAFYVPGRVEVLGKHTDYAGGRSLTAAVERGFSLVVRPQSDSRVTLLGNDQEKSEFEIGPDLDCPLGHWSNYPKTVARRLAQNFSGPLQGADIAFESSLPMAAGLSSSSALIVAIYLVLAEINRLSARREYTENITTPIDLAGYLGTIENGQSFGSLAGEKGVGTFGGSEDQTAILCSQPHQLGLYSYCPVVFEQAVGLPAGKVLALAASGVTAEKTGTALDKYNRASRLVSELIEKWNAATHRQDPHLAAALHSRDDAIDAFRMIIAQTEDAENSKVFLDRLNHFYLESDEIIPRAVAALVQVDLEEFGRQVDRSQEFAETLLGNQVPETVCLARTARECGAIAASAFGAGFGGSVWALIEEDSANDFLSNWAESYHRQFSQHSETSEFFITAAGPPAIRLIDTE
jgi:galactokinase